MAPLRQIDYGVTPWVGPPTIFTGVWYAAAMHDQTGAAVDGGAKIYVDDSPPYGSVLSIEAGFRGEPVSHANGGEDYATMTLTSDGHGFNGRVGAGAVPIHARVNKANQMHLELDTAGVPFVSPTNLVDGSCTKTISGIAVYQ